MESEALGSLPVRPTIRPRRVDASCPSERLSAHLVSSSPQCSTIAFTVCPKADSLFKIVGAASIAAKVSFASRPPPLAFPPLRWLLCASQLMRISLPILSSSFRLPETAGSRTGSTRSLSPSSTSHSSRRRFPPPQNASSRLRDRAEASQERRRQSLQPRRKSCLKSARRRKRRRMKGTEETKTRERKRRKRRSWGRMGWVLVTLLVS